MNNAHDCRVIKMVVMIHIDEGSHIDFLALVEGYQQLMERELAQQGGLKLARVFAEVNLFNGGMVGGM